MGDAPLQKWRDAKEKYNVSFVGAKKFERELYINELEEKGTSVNSFGKGWENGFVNFDEMLDIFRNSKINLNFTQTQGNKIGWKGRIFEVCLAGGFLLTEYMPGLEKYFKIGKEIVCFGNKEDLCRKIDYYLSHDKERRAIARAGWKKAINNYTSYHVLLNMFGDIEWDITKNKKLIAPPKIELTKAMRRKFSDNYFRWAVALSMENYRDLWRDCLSQALKYNPHNIAAICYAVIGFLPPLFRRRLRPFCDLYVKLGKELNLRLLAMHLISQA
jgi:hypothetical protein